MAYKSVNPATGEELKSYENVSEAELEARLSAAEACYQVWRKLTYEQRATIVMKASVLLHEQADMFAQFMTQDMGKLSLAHVLIRFQLFARRGIHAFVSHGLS